LILQTNIFTVYFQNMFERIGWSALGFMVTQNDRVRKCWL